MQFNSNEPIAKMRNIEPKPYTLEILNWVIKDLHIKWSMSVFCYF